MKPFAYRRAEGISDAVTAGAAGATFLAGGTELLNLMRLTVTVPDRVLDISRIPGLDRIEVRSDGSVVIGALVRLGEIARHLDVVRQYPVLVQAVSRAASPQLRNLATLGGNLLQSTRCAYFRTEDAPSCNKRSPGSGCAARNGLNDRHAIFGWSEACVATHPSDPAVALAVLDATIITDGPGGGRRISITDLHPRPGSTPERDTILRPGEIITAVELPAPAPRSAYLKVSQRAAYAFAIVSAAVALDVENGLVRKARVALGSVAYKPWRLETVERGLPGLRIGTPAALALVDAAFAEAAPLAHNAYKIPMARNALLRALTLAEALA